MHLHVSGKSIPADIKRLIAALTDRARLRVNVASGSETYLDLGGTE
jgi:hypothetical protein